MAILYGYFRSEEEARRAALRCQELGMTSAVLAATQTGDLLDDSMVSHTMRRREGRVMRFGLIGALVCGVIGMFTWFLIPALSNKLFLAGPLLAALYGAAIGIVVGMWLPEHRHFADEDVPADIRGHATAERVVVVNLSDRSTTQSVEEMLEAQGAVEIIHKAA